MIAGIVLAAGKSTRMGRAKALLSLGDGPSTFLSRIVDTFRAAGIDDLVIVLGHEADPIRQAYERAHGTASAVKFVVNDGYERGQLSSLVAGIDAVDRPDVEAALVTLVDVPLATVATMSALIDRYRQTRAPIVRPVRGEVHGHPVMFDRALFDELRQADPAAGAKPVVRRYASSAGDVTVADEGAFTDIDTPDEYARLTSVSRGRR